MEKQHYYIIKYLNHENYDQIIIQSTDEGFHTMLNEAIEHNLGTEVEILNDFQPPEFGRPVKVLLNVTTDDGKKHIDHVEVSKSYVVERRTKRIRLVVEQAGAATFAGELYIEAYSEEEAMEKAKKMSEQELMANTIGWNFGYVEPRGPITIKSIK